MFQHLTRKIVWPGKELHADRRRAAARWLPTTVLKVLN